MSIHFITKKNIQKMNTKNELNIRREGTLYGPVCIGQTYAFELFKVQMYLKELVSLSREHERLKAYDGRRAAKSWPPQYHTQF